MRLISRGDRIFRLQMLFKNQTEYFFEDNLPTNVAIFFEDVLKALPSETLAFDLESLFGDALKEHRRLHTGL